MIFLLDAGGAALLFVPLLFFTLICVIGEALFIYWMKLAGYGKGLGQALTANLVSLIAGAAIFSAADLDMGSNVMPGGLWMVVLYLATVLVEGGVLLLFNRNAPSRRVWTASFLMNLLTYAILSYFFLSGGFF